MLTLHLYNGAGSNDELWEIDDWGPEERILGPFEVIQVTYACHIKCYPPDSNDVFELTWDADGLIPYDGKVFGDMSIFPHTSSSNEANPLV